MPSLVIALDFSFGLRCRGIAEGNAIKAQGFAELGGLDVGKENGVIIHVNLQRQAAGQKGFGKQIKVGQQIFRSVNLGVGMEA